MTTEQLFENIAPIVRAINELHRPGRGFALLGSNEEHLVTSELDKNLNLRDNFLLYLHEFDDRTYLLLFQTVVDQRVVHVIDPEPHRISQTRRIAFRQSVHDRLHERLEVPEQFTWIFQDSRNR